MSLPIIIHTRQMEPLTVVALRPDYLQKLREEGAVRLAVMGEPRFLRQGEPLPDKMEMRAVTLFAVRVRTGFGDAGLTAVVNPEDEADALRLPSTFLPGQRRHVQLLERSAFLRGVIKSRLG